MSNGKAITEQGQSLAQIAEQNLARLESLATEAKAREVTSDRDKVRLENRGDFLIGRLVEIRVFPAKKDDEKDQHTAYIDLVDGRQVRLNLPTDLSRKLTADLNGHFVGIANEGVKDTGHRTGTPMTVFRVYDFGSRLSEKLAAMAETLPF